MRLRCFAFACVLTVSLSWLAFAQATVAGSASTIASFGFDDPGELQGLSALATLSVFAPVDDYLSAYLTIEATAYPMQLYAWDPADAALLAPSTAFVSEYAEFALVEAFMLASLPFAPDIELQAGQLYYSAGRADKLRPNDLLCPNDLRDPFAFGEKLPVIALIARWNMPWLDGTIDVAWAPLPSRAAFSPALAEQMEAKVADAYREAVSTSYAETIAEIDAEMDAQSFTEDKPRFHGAPIVDYSDWDLAVDSPIANVANGSWLLRFSGSFLGFDFAFTGARRISDVPYVSGIEFEQVTTIYLDGFRIEDGAFGLPNPTCDSVSTVTTYTQGYRLSYLGEWTVGFDAVKDFGFLMAWVDVCAYFPDIAVTTVNVEGKVNVILPSSGGIRTETVSVSEENDRIDPYVKWTFGADRFFEGGWYVNVQLAHGLPVERGEIGFLSCQDYLVALLRKSFAGDTIIIDLTTALNADDALALMGQMSDTAAWCLRTAAYFDLAVAWKPTDSLALTIGASLIVADPSSNAMLASMDAHDSIRVAVAWSW